MCIYGSLQHGKQKMKKQENAVYVLTIAIAFALSTAFAFYQMPIAFGILLGSLIGLVRHMAMSSFFTALLGVKSMNYFMFILYFIGNFGMIAIPLYIGSVYPNLVNVFGAAFGLVLHKIVLYLESFLLTRKER